MLAAGTRLSRPVKQLTRLVAILLVLAAAVLGAVMPASAAAPSDAVVVSAAPANSGDLAAGETLRVEAFVSNPNSVTTNTATATLSVARAPLASRAALAAWFDGKTKSSLASRAVAASAVPSVASGLSTGMNLAASSSALRFSIRGVYPIEVRITSGTEVLGVARSAVIWNVASATAVPVAIAVPLTVPATSGEFLSAGELTQYTAADGILTRELAEVQDSQIAIGIDPRIIASIRVLGNSAPASATTWLAELAQLPNETFPLSWADADVTAPLRAGATGVLRQKALDYAIKPALFPPTNGSTSTPSPSGGGPVSAVPTSASLVSWNYTMPTLGWPAEDSVQAADLPKLGDAGMTSAILTTSNVRGGSSRGLSGASGTSGSLRLAVSDDTLSAYLRAALESPNHTASLEAMTQLSATLALVSLESGKNPRSILLTLNRNWASSDADVAHTVSAIYERPWASSTVLSSALAESPTALKLGHDSENKSRIALISRMLAAEQRVVRFAPVAAEPDAITSSSRLQLLSVLSDEWLDAPAAWTAAATAYVTESRKVVDSVQVTKSSTFLGLADQLELPISISNGLDQDVTVNLLVRPTTPLVSIDKKDRFQTITIGADSQKRIQVPMQAVSNGKAELVVRLTSVTGVPIGKAVVVRGNVQAGWETLGTLIFVALIVALFAFGIIRNILKRRSAPADAPADGAAE